MGGPVYKIVAPKSPVPLNELDQLYQLDKDFFPTPWTRSSWDNLHQEEHLLIFALLNDELVGFSLFQISPADSFAHLLKIITKPEKRQLGIAKNLLELSHKELSRLQCIRLFLEVEETNIGAIELYKKSGFKIIHRKKDFYGQNRAALIMTCS